MMPGGGDFVLFFPTRGQEFCTESCPRGWDFDGKNSGPAVSPGGMVTGQIDTCITQPAFFQLCHPIYCIIGKSSPFYRSWSSKVATVVSVKVVMVRLFFCSSTKLGKSSSPRIYIRILKKKMERLFKESMQF